MVEKLFSDYLKRVREEMNYMDRIIADCEYMEWLAEFTKTYRKFCNDSWLSSTGALGKRNADKVLELGIFFAALENYSGKRCIEGEAGSGYYLIQYKGVGYRIGTLPVFNSSIFVERTDEITDKYIDFKSIVGSKSITINL